MTNLFVFAMQHLGRPLNGTHQEDGETFYSTTEKRVSAFSGFDTIGSNQLTRHD